VVVVVELEIMATRSSRPGTTAGTKASEAAGLVTSTVAPVGSLQVSTRQQSKGNNNKESSMLNGAVDEIHHNNPSSEFDEGNILSQYSQLIEDKDVDMTLFFVLREGKTAATCQSALASTFLVRLDYDKEMK
jgi:hypothetical protein